MHWLGDALDPQNQMIVMEHPGVARSGRTRWGPSAEEERLLLGREIAL
jgi:hypothetical protein